MTSWRPSTPGATGWTAAEPPVREPPLRQNPDGSLVALEAGSWFVCFVPGIKKEWWQPLVHPLHRHVFALRPETDGRWTLFEPWWTRLLTATITSQQARKFLRWGAMGDVLLVRERIPGRSSQLRGWMTCAVLAAHLLGRPYFVFTPYQLYRRLIREPGVCHIDVSSLLGRDLGEVAEVGTRVVEACDRCAPGAPRRPGAAKPFCMHCGRDLVPGWGSRERLPAHRRLDAAKDAPSARTDWLQRMTELLQGRSVAARSIPQCRGRRSREARREMTSRSARSKTILGAIGLVLASSLAACAPAPVKVRSQTADGVTFDYGIVPAKVVRSETGAEPQEAQMHGGVPSDAQSYHVVLALFDKASGTRITDANVSMRTSGPGHPGVVVTPLQPMTINGDLSYGGYIAFPKAANYRLTFKVSRHGRSYDGATARFVYERP